MNFFNKKLKLYQKQIENFSYLSALQAFNIILPLITYPYLIRVLGKETYGLIVFAQAIISYLALIVASGFNFSATKEISIHRNDKIKLNEIFSSVMIIKCFLFIISFLFLIALLNFIPQAQGYETLFYLTMWICLFDILLPVWYFQGLEKMQYITLISLISRLFFLILIFILINSADDYLFVPIINGVGALFAGLYSIYIIFLKHKIRFYLVPFAKLKFYFFDSLPIFISNVSINFFLNTNKVIVGTIFGMAEVAYYDLAEKISLILKTPIQILGQALFPKVSKEKDFIFLRKSFKFSMYLSLLILFISLFMSNPIISIIGGPQMLEAIPLLRIMILSIIPVSISLFYANLVLISWGHNKDYVTLRVYVMLFYIICISLLYYLNILDIFSIVILVVLLEIVTAALAVFYCNKRKINFMKNYNIKK